MPWIVNVKEVDGDRSAVWLTEVEVMESGVMIASGRKTPDFIGTTGGDYSQVEESLRRSLEALTAESMLLFPPGSLVIGCMVGKQLEALLLESGGDEAG